MKFSGKMWPYDNFKSHKNTGFHPLFRRYNFQKTTGRFKLTPPPTAVLGLTYILAKLLQNAPKFI